MNAGELITAWCHALEGRNYSQLSIGQYRRTVTKFERWGIDNHVELDTARHVDIIRWLDSHRHAPCTRYAYTSTLASFYHWAILEEHLAHDPTARVSRPRLPRRLPRPADSQAISDALDSAHIRTVAMIACGAFAGMRRSEIAHLRAEDLLLSLEPPLVLLRGKGGRERLVPLHDDLIAALRAHGLPAAGWVFPSPITGRGLSPGHVGRLITEGFLSHVTPHQLRHWFGTRTYRDSDGDIRITQELLGHASCATTQIYTAFSRPRAAQVVRGLVIHRAPNSEEAA